MCAVGDTAYRGEEDLRKIKTQHPREKQRKKDPKKRPRRSKQKDRKKRTDWSLGKKVFRRKGEVNHVKTCREIEYVGY